MESGPLVMLITMCIVIAVVAVFLITVVTLLAQIWSRINIILGVVGEVVDKTEVVQPVISDIKEGITGGEAAIVGAVERLKVRKGYSDSPQSGFDDDRDREPAGIGTSSDVAPPASTF